MPFPATTWGRLLEPGARQEAEQFAALLQGYLAAQHDETGAHTDITADSLAIGATSYTVGEGIWMGLDNRVAQMRVGTVDGNRITWDGTNLTVVSASVTIDDTGILVAPATDVAGELGGYKFEAGTDWGMYGVNADGPKNLYLTMNNTVNDAFSSASINITASKTHASAAATVNITADTINITGAQTISGALAANGGIAVDTTAFTVANTTGNVSTTGTLAVTGATTLTGALAANGGITVDSTAFTVADTTGNTSIAGTLAAGKTTITTGTDGVLTLNYTGATDPNTQVAFYRGATLQGSITTTAATTAYNVASDARLKTGWRPPSYDLQTVLDIQVGDYDWIAGGTGTGVTAQQLHSVYPWAVTPGETWQVDYSKLTPLLIVAVQELKREVDALRAALKKEA